MSSLLRRTAYFVALWQGAMLVSARAAAAATTQFGKNLGDEAKGLAVALFLAVAGLMTLPVIGRRDVNGGLVLLLLVVVLGGFVFAQSSVKQVILQIWQSLVS